MAILPAEATPPARCGSACDFARDYEIGQSPVMMEIEREEVTMAEMIDRLRNMVRSAGELNLMKFFERAQSRRELVVAFLSVLELVRLSEISLKQRETFGEIMAQTVAPA